MFYDYTEGRMEITKDKARRVLKEYNALYSPERWTDCLVSEMLRDAMLPYETYEQEQDIELETTAWITAGGNLDFTCLYLDKIECEDEVHDTFDIVDNEMEYANLNADDLLKIAKWLGIENYVRLGYAIDCGIEYEGFLDYAIDIAKRVCERTHEEVNVYTVWGEETIATIKWDAEMEEAVEDEW